jgi:hypothetical protein
MAVILLHVFDAAVNAADVTPEAMTPTFETVVTFDDVID